MGRFLAVLGSILGDSGDDLGMIWACSGGVGSQACFCLEKRTYINFQNIDFVAIGGSCAVFYDEFAHLVPVPK